MKYYTGIGSRKAPPKILELATKVSKKLFLQGWTVRSGSADGMDLAFTSGISNKEGYLPWKGFNDCNDGLVFSLLPRNRDAELLASKIHPVWNILSESAKKLHTRNIYQVLGQDLETPSKFLIFWAEVDKDGIPKGGTRTAWVLAKERNIPCFNLYIESDKQRIEEWLLI